MRDKKNLGEQKNQIDLFPSGYLMFTLTKSVPKGWKLREEWTHKAEEEWEKLMRGGLTGHDLNGISVYTGLPQEGIFLMEKI